MLWVVASTQVGEFQEQLHEEDDRFLEKQQAFIERNKEEKEHILRRTEVHTHTHTHTHTHKDLSCCWPQDALKEKDEKYKKLEEDFNSMTSELAHEKRLRTDKDAQFEAEKTKHRNDITRIKQQCDWYLKRLANRLVGVMVFCVAQ